MSLSGIDTVKFDKEKPIQSYHRFKKIASVERTLQFCLAFLLFSWFIIRSSLYFPAAVELSRFIPHRLCTLVVNHHFGFLLGNLIIVILFVKSGHSASHNRRSSAVAGNDDDGFLIREFAHPHEILPVSCAIVTEEAVSDEKSSVPAVTEPQSPAESEKSELQITESEHKKYRRTRSEEFEAEATEKIQLRRSDTEPRREIKCSGADSRRRRRIQQVEDLSNEEFQRKVEAFIERQQRFLREESLSMALRNRISA